MPTIKELPGQHRDRRALLFDEVATKWPELLIEMVPRVQRICVLFDPSLSGERQSEAVAITATKLGKTLLPIRIGNVDAIPDALERARGDALGRAARHPDRG